MQKNKCENGRVVVGLLDSVTKKEMKKRFKI